MPTYLHDQRKASVLSAYRVASSFLSFRPRRSSASSHCPALQLRPPDDPASSLPFSDITVMFGPSRGRPSQRYSPYLTAHELRGTCVPCTWKPQLCTACSL